jgi:hypothetical protein
VIESRSGRLFASIVRLAPITVGFDSYHHHAAVAVWWEYPYIVLLKVGQYKKKLSPPPSFLYGMEYLDDL